MVDSVLPAMEYYLDKKNLLVYSINIKNSVYEIGNYAHENLVEKYFTKATFINTTINNIDQSNIITFYFKSLIYKKVDESTKFHLA